jgi:hypothetical protein
MANTLTALIPSLQVSMQSVIRERTPISSIVDTSYGVERAALGQTVPVASTAAIAGADNTPGVNPPSTTGLTPTKVDVGITKSRIFQFGLTGEERRSMQQNGPMFQSEQAKEAIRAAINEVWADVAALYGQASLAFGTPGTNPFASNADAAWDLKTLLDDASAPDSGRSMILDPLAYNSLGKLNLLQNVSSAGATETLREGIISRLAAFNVGWANSIKTHTKGTGSGYQVNNGAGYPVGATTITVDTGTGTIVAGDVVTFAGDSTKYIVTGLTATTLTLNTGLKQAVADNTAITVVNGAKRYLVGHKSAIAFGIRPPAQPTEDGSGDMADDRVIITDPDTGLAMSFAVYKGYGQVTYQAELAWGGKVVRPDWLKNLLF